jgi:hypothetical protein
MIHFFTLVAILVFANWGKPSVDDNTSAWHYIFTYKWYITGFFSLVLAWSLVRNLRIKWQWVLGAVIVTGMSVLLSNVFIESEKLRPIVPMLVGIAALSIITLLDRQDEENREWTLSSWGFAKQIIPLLGIGVVIAGFLLGSTHDDQSIAGIIPNEWIAALVGGNSVFSNFFASLVGAFMYFATLTEVPIIQGLIASGMGKGPALALLLAGPSLSLPNMLVIKNIIGFQKTAVYVSLVVVMATVSGLIYGGLF